ncbi:hypothetical protein AAG570_008618 [Ranatra chinensis]|uniref:Insulin-like domain-containing protein n=1 Tax=Ranatra chinensis TaxID=642074 RepID=A0ABD0YRF1_9HEMI
MKTLTAVLILLLALAAVDARGDIVVQACGDRLPEMLRDACQGLYHSPQMRKKNEGGLDNYEMNDFEYSFPTSPKHRTHSLSDRFHRVTRGVIEECCRRPCLYTDLLLYCQN